jgi:hypothetical protein
MFAKSLPMIQDTTIETFELLCNHPELKDKLWENVNALQSGLKEEISILAILILVRLFILKEVFQKRWLW